MSPFPTCRPCESVSSRRLTQCSFHDKLNPLIALLDPQRTYHPMQPMTESVVHTLDYVRHSSSILFTAILAASSKFFRKELHAALLSHAHSILNRATNKASCSTGIIQALMILVYWKAPSDRSGWLKIGMAVRMGYQLGWHLTMDRPLPTDELAARRTLVSSVLIVENEVSDGIGSRENMVL